MRCLIAWLLIALCVLAVVDAVAGQSPTRITQISRSQDVGGARLVYLVEAPADPAITVEAGRANSTAVQDDAGGWRVTITATLDSCRGRLWIDSTLVVQQRCTWLPQVAR